MGSLETSRRGLDSRWAVPAATPKRPPYFAPSLASIHRQLGRPYLLPAFLDNNFLFLRTHLFAISDVVKGAEVS